MKKWIAGVLATVVTGVLVFWLTQGALNIIKTEPGSQTSSGLTEKWAGNWLCKATDHEMRLTITGQGSSSSLKGYYPVAYGNRPATEEYIIRNISASNASGEYIYYDASPNVGYQGKAGVWNGDWSITLARDVMVLTRKDHTTSWQGEYQCTKR
jgi:hypothetical protein